MTTAVVVYESMFGNTEAIAQAIGEGLAASGRVDVRDVSVGTDLTGEVNLIVAGGPTHAFSMSRPSTRADAVKQGAAASRATTGLREWLEALDPDMHEAPIATYDTRVDKVRRMPGSAARKALRVARGRGFRTLGSESFYVRDTSGPLLDGELERARDWGRRLGAEADSRRRG